MGNHALLSASSSHRWLNCPPSARLCEKYEDTGSEYQDAFYNILGIDHMNFKRKSVKFKCQKVRR